jgi:putative transposase
MKKSRFTEEQFIKALKRQEAGEKVQDICRDLGVSQQAFYKWKAKYGGLEVSEAQRLKALEDENRKLKQLVAEQDNRSGSVYHKVREKAN